MTKVVKLEQRKIFLDKSNRYCYNILMFHNKRLNVSEELERIKKKRANRKPMPWRLILGHPLTWILLATGIAGVLS